MTVHRNDERAQLLEDAIRVKKAQARAPEIAPRPADAPAHLSEMQQSVWLAHQMDPRSPAYNLASAFRLRGPLDVAELERALNDVVARHRMLRSTFRIQGDAVHQLVHPHAPVTVEVIEAADGDAIAAAVRAAREPFDLETGPLVRMQLVEEPSQRERLLLLVLHHILADEQSLGLLWKELARAYADRAGTEAPIQYDDYVHWLRGASSHQRELDYWKRRLDPLPVDLSLPFERPSRERGRGRLLVRDVPPAVQESIRRVAAATATTPFAIFAFAFRLLLQRYTGGERIAFATPASTRSHPATAKMVGYFLNPVVVAAAIDESPSVDAAVRAFSRELRKDVAHASLPFHALAETLSPPRERDRHPLFRVMFVHQETAPPPKLGEARLEPVTLDLGASKFDLTLFASEGGAHSLQIALEYRADRFDEPWMERLLGHYRTLLEHLGGDLDRSTSEVSMLSADERDELRAVSRGALLNSVEIDCLPREILDRARRSPDAPAVTCAREHWSYRELAGSASSLAHELAARGVKPGDRVGLFVDRSLAMIAGALAIHWAGAAYVPLDPAYPEARTRNILEGAEVSAVLTTRALERRLPEGAWETVDVDRSERDEREPEALAPLAPDAPAYILYTSGSTGRPKGVVVTHENLRASTAARLAYYQEPPKRFLLVPSIAFDSSVAGLFWTLATGGTLVVPTDDEARDPRKLAELIADARVTSLLCVPSLYASLLGAGGELLAGLESAIVAGESSSSALVAEHVRALPHVRLFNEYGPTEATVWATVQELTAEDAARPVAIGRPIPGVHVDVSDAFGRPVPAGIPGQAWIAGPTVAAGYWRRPDLTAERFVAGRGYRTGDRMAWTLDGRLLFLGRDDEQIKLRGFRIEPGEIEAALVDSPAIEQAAVVARPVGAGAEAQLVAFVRAGSDVTIDTWRQDLAARVPEHMLPSRLVTLSELPFLPNGKIDRGKLRAMELAPETSSESAAVPGTREQSLVSLWEGLLGRSGIGVDDNFFELGGHSLLVVEMTSAIARDFEIELGAADVFESPTVRGLARRIEERRGGGATEPYEHLFPIQPTGRGMPFIVAVPHVFTPTFAARYRGERPVYGLRGVGLRAEGNRGRWRTMTELGADLADEIQRRFPGETCTVAGYSFGASMAFEVVRLMEERGMPVAGLYLIAPMPVDVYRFGPFRFQLDGLQQPVDDLSAWEAVRRYARYNHPLTRRLYRRAWRRLAVEPWRRLLCTVGKLRALAGLPLTRRILHADVRVERFRLHARWRPGVVKTPTVIFNARDAGTDAAATWRPHFGGRLSVHETPDPHLGDASVEAAREVILRHLSDVRDA